MDLILPCPYIWVPKIRRRRWFGYAEKWIGSRLFMGIDGQFQPVQELQGEDGQFSPIGGGLEPVKITTWDDLIGNMTNQEGLIAITNEDDTDAARTVAAADPGNAGYDYGVSTTHNVTRWVVQAPDGVAFRGGSPTIGLLYSDDDVDWSGVADSFTSDNSFGETKDRVFSSAGAHRYWRTQMDGGTGAENGRFTRLNLYA